MGESLVRLVLKRRPALRLGSVSFDWRVGGVHCQHPLSAPRGLRRPGYAVLHRWPSYAVQDSLDQARRRLRHPRLTRTCRRTIQADWA